MKGDISEYVAQCDTCRRVIAEHQRPVGLLQPLHIPVWKWAYRLELPPEMLDVHDVFHVS